MTRRRLVVIAGAAGLIAVAGLAPAWRRARSTSATQAARRGPIVEGVYGLGTVTADKTHQLKVYSGGSVDRVFVREGDVVAKGAPLLSLEPEPTFRAPFRGTVTAVFKKAGEIVSPHEVALTMADLADRYLVVSLEQQGALRVRPGQKAELSFESMRERKFEGRVRAVYPNEGQFLVRVEVDELPPEILPGMTADVAIEINRKADALLVPAAALSMGRVVVVEGGRRRKIPLKIGLIDGEWAEVLDGEIKAGARVAVPRP